MSIGVEGTVGYHPDGKVAFKPRNLRGLQRYASKHGIKRIELGDCISGDGLYEVIFSNGVKCKGLFASPRIMMSYFLTRSWSGTEIEMCRGIFNKGCEDYATGRVLITFMCPIGRDGECTVYVRSGLIWDARAFRDEKTHTPLVLFTRR